MTSALTRFGTYCRRIRSSIGSNMADQAAALGCEISEISSIETGQTVPTSDYVERFCAWLSLEDKDRIELISRIPKQAIVIEFPRKPGVTKSLRLFRTISRMSPAQIRAFRKENQTGVPDD